MTQAKVKETHLEVCILVIYLDDLKDVDFNPVRNLLMEIDESEIDAVDILHRSSSCFMNVEYVLSLLHAVNKKLRVVDLQDMPFGKDLLLYVMMHFVKKNLCIP